jgi:hypothetical protein
VLGIDWTAAGVGGAFVIGAVFGVIVAIRLTRTLLEVVMHVHRRVEKGDDD